MANIVKNKEQSNNIQPGSFINGENQAISEWLKIMKEFIGNSISLIKSNRESSTSLSFSSVNKVKLISKLKEFKFDFEEDEDTDEDVYKDLRLTLPQNNTFKSVLEERNRSTNTNQLTKYISAVVYFNRKNIKFIVEIVKFTLTHRLSNGKTNFHFRKNYLVKKLLVLSRSIMTLMKILPVYSLLNKNGFDFYFDINVANKNINPPNDIAQDYQKMKFLNISDHIGSLKIEVSYLNKCNIFKYEEDLLQKIISEEMAAQRPRCMSSDGEDGIHNNNCLVISDTIKCDVNQLQRSTSKSADKLGGDDAVKYSKYNNENNVDTLENSPPSATLLLENSNCILLDNDDFQKRLYEVKKIERQYKQMNFLYFDSHHMKNEEKSLVIEDENEENEALFLSWHLDVSVNNSDSYSDLQLTFSQDGNESRSGTRNVCDAYSINQSYINKDNKQIASHSVHRVIDIESVLGSMVTLRRQLGNAHLRLNVKLLEKRVMLDQI